ncbi:MAG: iron ABC transporter ATP-binding protein [Deltaproteobacteria bacterium HGW-Deltaproteobacteria-8]|jgi:iron complex transport system ATP-binding protein|nr:MAG: iron ABC transporter ATP-binding protein [Deltaproteobacteria bacterium HGW-Deltaproteobacteria-8]
MIRVASLRVNYGRREALRGVDLHVARGELVGLCGPNGSGKTTLIKALAGLLSAASGTIEINGADIATLSHRERALRLSCVPQRTEVPAGFSVRELVLMGRFAHTGLLTGFLSDYGPEDHAAVEAALRDARADNLAERQAAELSGGEIQRVLLARALAQGREVLLLDEAVSALDMARRVEAYDLLATLNKNGGTILSALHDLNLAALYCPRLVFLKAGLIALDGPTTDIFTESNLKDIYETDIRVAAHPVTGAPQAHLVPGAVAAALG